MKLEGVPTQIALRDGSQIVIRPMEAADAPAVHAFFKGLPEEDRQYLRDDVTRQEWIDRFVRSIDYDTVVPLIAEHGGRVVGNGTLYRHRHGWTKHVGEIRVSVAKDFQRKGVGTALMRLLVRQAISLGLEKMVAQVVDNQVGAKRSFAKAGFTQEAVLKSHVKDVFGVKRDLIVMSNDVSHLWEAMESLVADFHPSHE